MCEQITVKAAWLVGSEAGTGVGPVSAQPLGPRVKPEAPGSSSCTSWEEKVAPSRRSFAEAVCSVGTRAQSCPRVSTEWSPQPTTPATVE